MNAEIIAIGSELLTAFKQDTNSLFLTGKLNDLGVKVDFKTVVGDHRADLVAAIRIAVSRAEIILLMGGLGPTEDDLTREAAAEALSLELKRDPEIVAGLYKRFAARRITMAENNLKQADVIAGAEVLPNRRGSAPGQFLKTEVHGRMRILCLLPGPPREIHPMFEEQCVERLRRLIPPLHIATRVLKIALIPESEADRRAAPIYTRCTDIETTILAHRGEIQLHLRSQSSSLEDAQKKVDALASELEDEFDDSVFSTKGETLEQIVGYYLQMRGDNLSVAESCTGGMVSQRITSVPGSSRYFVGGAVVYDNSLKADLAGVPPLLIKEHGAVSREVAVALAEGIRKRCRTTLGVGVTGIAGPGGGAPEKPVGLVFHAIADAKTTDVVERHFPGDRDLIRQWATTQALDLVRRKLMQ